MAAYDFPDNPSVGTVFDKWTWNGTMWALTVGQGAGFTFTQEFKPTPTKVGDTWFDTSIGASGGTSWVAILEGTAGSELVWVQTSAQPPPTAPPPAAAHRSFSCGTLAVAVGAIVTIPYVGGTTTGIGIGNRVAGLFAVPKGCYLCTLQQRWSTSFSTPILQVDLGYTDDQTNIVSIGTVSLISSFGVTHQTFSIDHPLSAPANREFLFRVFNATGPAMTLNSASLTVVRVADGQ